MRYASIRNMDISNGQGVGISLFVQGCHFHCYNCFNSETWDFNKGKEWTEEIQDTFLQLANKDYITRISLLGGECLAKENLDGILNLVDKIRILYGDTKSIWLYTGYDFDEIMENFAIYQYTPFAAGADEWLIRYEIISKCDVLIDGKYVDSLKDSTLKWRGSSNQHIINIKKRLNDF